MSWLKAITGGVIGAEALSLVKEYVEKEGGLNAVVKNFQNGGFKRQVNSWISTGKNQAISGIEVGQAIGIEKIKKLAESAGIDINKARDLLAEYLPIAIDKATPEGTLPAPEKGDAKKSLYLTILCREIEPPEGLPAAFFAKRRRDSPPMIWSTPVWSTPGGYLLAVAGEFRRSGWGQTALRALRSNESAELQIAAARDTSSGGRQEPSAFCFTGRQCAIER